MERGSWWVWALVVVGAVSLSGRAEGRGIGARCSAHTDSTPSSLGADGWATVGDEPVQGGCGARRGRVEHASSRSQLVAALGGTGRACARGRMIEHEPKIIYVHGTIDLNVDDVDQPLREEDYMRLCQYTAHATFYDPITGDQSGSGGFFGAYKAAYDPGLWLRQSLDAADGRPPALSGPLEEARACFAAKQAERVVIDVGSNTSLIGVGADARVVNGTLRIGFIGATPDPTRDYVSRNVVIRNITFADAFDMFPGWDPKDSFSITLTNANGCQASYDAATDSGPHRCTVRGGRWNSEYDSISVMNAEQVWIDHNTFTDDPRPDAQFPPVFAAPFNEATQKVQHHDGAVDVTLLGSKVTVSFNKFLRHDKVSLLGGTDRAGAVPGYGPGVIDVTFHHNYYENTVQRMPRVRFGRVHVYNNVYNNDRNTVAAYRLGDTWQDGTAGKLVTENDLLDIHNTNTIIPRIVNYASTVANRDVCVAAGYTAEGCGTYFFDRGTYVTMLTATATSVTLFDAFAALQAIVAASASNAPLLPLSPTDPATFWFPTLSYSYAAALVDTEEDRNNLRLAIVAAGAGAL
jgi:pectate lyase